MARKPAPIEETAEPTGASASSNPSESSFLVDYLDRTLTAPHLREIFEQAVKEGG